MKPSEKKKCKDCAGKGFYTQMFGLHYASDFDFKGGATKPKIHMIACPTCNFRNKRRLKDVIKSQFHAQPKTT